MPQTVWVVGSLNQDLHLHVERHPRTGETLMAGDLEQRFGGKGANQAVAAATAGASTSMVGAVGGDAAGQEYLERLSAFGIDVSGVSVVPDATTGTAVIAVDAAGDNMIMVAPGANHRLGRDEVSAALAGLRPGDVVLIQLEIPVDVAIRAIGLAHDRGARVVANLAPYADLPAQVLGWCDPVVVNEHEHAQLVTSHAADEVASWSVLVTRGEHGSAWGDIEVPAVPVAVVDTTGAGDSFCGALAAGLVRGLDRRTALVAAAAAAATCVGRPGAQPTRA